MFKAMFPEVFVSDCDAVARFFEQALGFQRGYTLTEGDHLDFAVMRHPDANIRLFVHQMLPPEVARDPRTVRLYFEPEDIHALCAELRAKGFAVTEPARTDYGSLEADLAGPDGYLIRFQQWL